MSHSTVEAAIGDSPEMGIGYSPEIRTSVGDKAMQDRCRLGWEAAADKRGANRLLLAQVLEQGVLPPIALDLRQQRCVKDRA